MSPWRTFAFHVAGSMSSVEEGWLTWQDLEWTLRGVLLFVERGRGAWNSREWDFDIWRVDWEVIAGSGEIADV